MATPKDEHTVEQAIASMAAMGAAFARMYRSLREEGVPADHAVRIVCSYAQGLGQRQEK